MIIKPSSILEVKQYPGRFIFNRRTGEFAPGFKITYWDIRFTAPQIPLSVSESNEKYFRIFDYKIE